ncbi:MAG: restriction endonuclease subunit S [Acidobacteriota bacterium]|nr:restriction endonuclease subunit S [Acidobacteriota bacterium]
MIADLKPYPAMKGSGVPWLGEVPEHWMIERSKWLFRKKKRPVCDSDEVITCFRDGKVTLRKNRRLRGFTESLKEIGYQGIRRGDLVIHAMDAFAGAIGVADADGKGTPVYSVCEPRSSTNSHYYAYALREMARSQWIQALQRGIRERSTDFRYEEFGSQSMPCPPLPEQAAIVRFLDYVDRRIQRYIRAKQKLIKLLEEQKQVVIHEAVTGRIDVRTGKPYPAYKDSGVEWLGDVPEHWDVRRLKSLCTMRSGEGITGQSIDSKGEYPVYGGNGVRGFTSKYTHEGDFVLIGRQGALCGNIHFAHGRFWASEHAVVVSLCYDHNLGWFGAILNVMNLNQYSIAAAQPGLAVERILSLWLPVPPKQEQDLIHEYLRNRTLLIRKSLDLACHEIALLREYRTRLIADVVTGKLDVREAAAQLPDEVEEIEPNEEMASENIEEEDGVGGFNELLEKEEL